jgi:hypothetical protein
MPCYKRSLGLKLWGDPVTKASEPKPVSNVYRVRCSDELRPVLCALIKVNEDQLNGLNAELIERIVQRIDNIGENATRFLISLSWLKVKQAMAELK